MLRQFIILQARDSTYERSFSIYNEQLMSRQLAQAFISNGVASRKTSSKFLYSLHPRSIPTFEPRLSSSLVSSHLQDGGSGIDQGEANPRGSRRDDSGRSKTKHQTNEFGAEITRDKWIYLQDILVASKERENYYQKTSVQQQSTKKGQPAGTSPSENHPLLSPPDPAERIDTAIDSLIHPDTSSYENSGEGQQPGLAEQNAIPLQNQELEKGRMQEFRRTHFLDALRPKDAIYLAEKPAIDRHLKALKHDELRSKDTCSFDWSIPLFELQNALPEQRAKIIEKSSCPIPASEFEETILVNNDYVGVPVSSIPVPKIWTKASFAQHVHDISRSQKRGQFGTRVGAPESASHQTMVCKRLEEVMFIPENAALVTSAALESAVRFYYKFGMLPSVQRLYFYMKEISHPFPETIIDTILRYAAKDKDLHNFTSLLQGARSQGFVPSEMTWASLLLCLQSNESQKVVLYLMCKYELLQSNQTRQDVALVELDMALADTLDFSDIEKLVDRMDTQHGQNWLAIRSANAILKSLCESLAGQPITDFLDLMVKRGCMPNIDSMNILLQRCRRITDFEAALEVLNRFADRHFVIPDQTSYLLLFRTAWDSRRANTCKILWAAVCTHRRMPFPIRRLIKTSLLETKPASDSHAWHRWKWHAGKLIVGIDPRQTVSNNDGPAPVQSSNKSTVFPSTACMKEVMALTPEDDKTQKLRESYAQALIQHDEWLHKQFYYTLGTVRSQLAQAYKMDENWKATGINTLPLEHQTKLMIKPSLRQHRKAIQRDEALHKQPQKQPQKQPYHMLGSIGSKLARAYKTDEKWKAAPPAAS